MQTPTLSLIVVLYNMEREAPRTLHSLSSGYQTEVNANEYEVVVIDNGSDLRFARDLASDFGPNFRYLYVENANPSPAQAINVGISMAKGHHIGLLVDGARIATPGLVRAALFALRISHRTVVSTLAWHLGPKTQMESIVDGYDAATEDALLGSTNWPQDGYDLFKISTLAGSSAKGFFKPIAESNALFMPAALVEELGGFDEAFDMPGGGVVNLDFYARSCALPDTTLVTLLGEGTFHQIHGGVATNAGGGPDYEHQAFVQYEQIRGHIYRRPERTPLLLGTVPAQAMPFMASSVDAWYQDKRTVDG